PTMRFSSGLAIAPVSSAAIAAYADCIAGSMVAKKSAPNFIRLTSTDSSIEGWTLRYSLYRSHNPRVMRGRVAGIERVDKCVGAKRLLQEKFSASGQRLRAQRRGRVRREHDDAHVTGGLVLLDRQHRVEPARARQRPVDDDGGGVFVANHGQEPGRRRPLDHAPTGGAQRFGIELAHRSVIFD